MKRAKVMCTKGAGQWAPRKMPTNLVDCPECGRRDLGSTPVGLAGGCDVDGHSASDGCYYGVVPPHAEQTLRPDEIRDFAPPPAQMEREFWQWCDTPSSQRYGTDFDMGML